MFGRKLQAADYAALAIAPLLIFVMLGSLGSFLVLVFYDGPYTQRVQWTLWMFTMGVVGIARIAISHSRSYALGYACILGVAAWQVMANLAGSVIFPLLVLPLIGFVADRIVRDCTVMDDRADVVSRGLLDGDWRDSGQAIFGLARRRGHQPGRSVLLLGMAALPLFGVGQFLLRDDPAAASRSRGLLLWLLISGLSLLVVTAFLNVRRDVRRRGTEMHLEVTVAWLAGGVGLVVGLVLLAYLAPLPGRAIASLDVSHWVGMRSELSQQASKWGWGDESATRSDGDDAVSEQRVEDAPPNAEVRGERNQQGAPPGGTRGDNDDGPPGQDEGGKKSAQGEQASGSENPSESSESSGPQGDEDASSGDSAATPDPSHSDAATPEPVRTGASPQVSVQSWVRWIVWAILAGFVAVVVVRFHGMIAAWWRSLFRDEPRTRPEGLSFQMEPVGPPPRPFSSFRNPIGSSDAKTVVVETFLALEAWSREHGVARGIDETPSEFVGRVASRFPDLALPGKTIVDAYNRIVFGRGVAAQADLQAAVAVWKGFT